MKKSIFSKVAAAVVACAMVLGMTATAFAADDFTYVGGDMSEWDFADPATAMTGDGKIVITYTDANDGWGDIGFGFSEGENWRSYIINNPAGTDATCEISIAELITNCKIEDVSALSFGKIEGYNGCVISKVEIAAGAVTDTPADDAPADDTPSGDSAATTAVIFAAVAALAVAATVSVKKYAVER